MPIFRDVFNEDFTQIVVDDMQVYKEVTSYVGEFFPAKEKIVHLYQGKENIFRYLGLESKLNNLLSEVVTLPGGGYLIVQQTEAALVFDVNTGNRVYAGVDQEALAYDVNILAAETIAQLMRVLSAGGLIFIDFIGMKNYQNRKALYEAMKEFVKNDRLRPEILPLNAFGVMEITRPRLRPLFQIPNREECVTCRGTGKIRSSMMIPEHLEEQVKGIMKQKKVKKIVLYLHPFLNAYINRGFVSKEWKWWWKFGKKITIEEDESLAITDYRIYDQTNRLIGTPPPLSLASVSSKK